MMMSLNRLSKPVIITLAILFAGFACSKSANNPSTAAPVTVKATISKDKITIGDKVEFLYFMGGGEKKFGGITDFWFSSKKVGE